MHAENKSKLLRGRACIKYGHRCSSESIEHTCIAQDILTRPNEPDAKATREVGDTGDEVATGDELAGGLPLLLVLGIPGRQLDLGEDPALRLLDAVDFCLLVLHDLLGIVGLDVGAAVGASCGLLSSDGGVTAEKLGLLGGIGTDDGLAAADEGGGVLVVIRHFDEMRA